MGLHVVKETTFCPFFILHKENECHPVLQQREQILCVYVAPTTTESQQHNGVQGDIMSHSGEPRSNREGKAEETEQKKGKIKHKICSIRQIPKG